MPRQPRHRVLYRSEIRQKTDKPTNSVVLQYVGRRMQWHDRVYGYDDGTFFVCNIDEIGYPPSLVELANELDFDIDQLPDARRLREAAADALASEGFVDAPDLIGDLATPPLKWLKGDVRELERKHMIAVARLTEMTRITAAEIRRRCLPICAPEPEPMAIEPMLPSAGIEYLPLEPEPVLPLAVAESPPLAPVEVVETVEVDEGALSASSLVVQRVRFAIIAAREAELPQRLPSGARRRLRQMPPGVYLAYGEALDIRSELCAAMTDGRALGRKGREVILIDWDGEWPVVPRRYGQGGRTIYKVEDALRRHGIEVKKAEVA
jgi:hypothetical protein